MQTCISPISSHDYLLIINNKTLLKLGKEWSKKMWKNDFWKRKGLSSNNFLVLKICKKTLQMISHLLKF
jgi:hypothetical protein